MPRLKVPVDVPPGAKYCHGCKAVLPMKCFKLLPKRNAYPARCEPCRRLQQAEQAEMRKDVALFYRDRAAWHLKHSTAI